MVKREIIAIIGDNISQKENKINEIKQLYGEYNFCDNLLELKPMQQWIIASDELTLLRAFDIPQLNILIDFNYMHQIPIEIRIWAKTYIYNRDIKIEKDKDRDLQFWKLSFQKYIPKDLQKKGFF